VKPDATCLACQGPMITASASRVHPTCEVNPDVLASELFGIIEQAIAHQPRSLQRRIGPSEIGVQCDRRIGYKLAGTPEVNRVGDVNWKAYIGTAIHEQFANIIARSEADALADPAWNGQRWHVEEKVSPGLTLDGVDIDGSCDLFDAHNGAVWDWKITTRNKIRETYRPSGVGSQYEVQAQLYGHGWARKGYEVRSVGVIFFTRDGEFSDRHVWHQPYDPDVAARAIARVTGIQNAIDGLGPDMALPLLATGDAYCRWCPYYSARAANDSRSCAGHALPQQEDRTLTQLIGA
jgi:hypothetical protein